MPRNRKIFVSKQSYFITFRAEEGLPLPPNPLINKILIAILCRAQSKYPVKVSAFVFMSNHVHIIITVIDPELVDDFILYLKRESAHAVNRLLGRRKRTIWCCGYDSPIILDVDKAIEKIAYIYSNPQTSNLVETIDEYPGLNSWAMLIERSYTMSSERIRRTAITKVDNQLFSLKQWEELSGLITTNGSEIDTFKLTPYAWLEGIETDLTEDESHQRVLKMVREREEQLRKERKNPVLGSTKIAIQPINSVYTPKKFSNRMLCLSSQKYLRIGYITWFREISKKAYNVYQNTKAFLQNIFELPPGTFAPGGMLYANLLYFDPLRLF